MGKKRLDLAMVEHGMAESRSLAQRLIMAGQVRVNGQMVIKPATGVDDSAEIQVESGPRFVSRGGEKLEAALLAFKPQVYGKICADIGASTGGFTDCLLQNGAKRVYSIDVGTGILDWKLRNDPRVVVMEGANARYIERLTDPVQLVTIDASFISLKTLLPVARGWLGEEGGQVIALIKPQFEAGKHAVGKGKGVVRDPAIHNQVIRDVVEFAQRDGYTPLGLIRSPLVGPKGNAEFLVYLGYPQRGGDTFSPDIIDRIVEGKQ
jgi:23S rRNA (cytidine1920-2'-O)/16S rRNA (cytidine1409-2'-O)-methyltransferase